MQVSHDEVAFGIESRIGQHEGVAPACIWFLHGYMSGIVRIIGAYRHVKERRHILDIISEESIINGAEIKDIGIVRILCHSDGVYQSQLCGGVKIWESIHGPFLIPDSGEKHRVFGLAVAEVLIDAVRIGKHSVG